jgi:glycerophosphoryl diester phosphodiesterase
MPAGERDALRQWVARAHAQGRKVRFWNTPDRAEAWRILTEAGVDVIGTDDLSGLQEFLLTWERGRPRPQE